MSDITDEYRTIASGAGWNAARRHGWLRFDGRDVLTFLQALVSQDVAALVPGRNAYATYLTPQGRMVTDLEVFAEPERVLVRVPAGLSAPLAVRFDALVFSEDVHVTDVSADVADILVMGANAAVVLAAALGLPTGALTALDAGAHLPWPHGLVAARQNRDLPTYLVTIRGTERVDRVARDLGAAGAVQVSDAAVEGMRLMEGRPRFGADMNEETIPLEAGLLDRAISTTKGCYVGQEIVIRILHRGGGRVAKRLATLSLDAAAAASQPGAVLRDRDRPVGALTSVARSPRTGKPIALGYVARDAAVEGAVVGIDGGGRATITGFAR